MFLRHTPPWFQQDWLAARAQATPERPALYRDGEVWTYADLDRQVDQVARGLRAQGMGPGRRVAFWRLPRKDALVLVWAVARVGAVLVPFHGRWTPREGRMAARVVAPHLLVVPEDASEARAMGVPTVSWEMLRAPQDPRGASTEASVPRALGEVQGVVFTSGSTGRPKAATLTWRQHFWSAWASAARLGLEARDAWLLTLPLYHVGGLAILWRSVLYGIPVLLPPQEGSFDPQGWLRWTPPRRPSLISVVPTMLYRILEVGMTPWPGLRVVLVGGAAAPEALLEEALARGWPVALTYGLTEAASQVATAPPELVRRKPGTVGPPMLFTRVVARDAAGRPLPPGEVGEITVQGPTVFPGYWGNGEATARALRDGWLYTGDEGYVDEEGHLWVKGRAAFAINTGGEKVYPQEVEKVLLQHPAVAQACVVGLPDEEWGQRVAAAVVLRPEYRVTAEDLARFCRKHLAGFKVPRRWVFVAELPRTASGKLDRRKVQSLF